MADEPISTTPANDGGGAAVADFDFDISTEADATPALEPTTPETPTVETPETVDKPVQEPAAPKEDPETAAYAGQVSGRIRNLVKQSPELGKLLAANPQLKNNLEASFRQNAAYRDAFPTVAEAKAMRERFPNGIQDVQEIESDIKEVEAIDNDFYSRDANGNYPGHGNAINRLFTQDRDAAVALFRHLPKEWARLDRDSYNDVMGKVVGATLIQTGSWEALLEFRDTLAGNDATKGLVAGLDKVLGRLNYFIEERKPTPEDQRLADERKRLDTDRAAHTQQTQATFQRSFVAESKKVQLEVIGQHRIMQKLATVKSITPEKRAEITEKVRAAIEKFLGNSPSFMRKLRPAYDSGNLDETLKVQRAAWSQEWLLNRMIGSVLRVETPQLVNSNRVVAERRAGPSPTTKPAASDNKEKAPFKQDGRWYHGNGRMMTVEEAMRHSMASS